MLWFGARSIFAAAYTGQVTFGGVPVPGATVTARHGSETVAVLTDERGVFRFAQLADGPWQIEIKLQLFQTLEREVTVGPSASAAEFSLEALPLAELTALSKTVLPRVFSTPALQVPAEKKTDANATAPADMPNPESGNDESADGLLVNGSVNNAATSQFSLSQAFGNRRPNSGNLYNGGFALIFDNSALDARQYALAGYDSPKPAYGRLTAGFTLGGPLRIPHVLPRGPNLFIAYQGTRDHDARTDSALVPTAAERGGNLAGSLNQPSTIVDPATGQPFPGSVVPVSAQAQDLLALYPLPNVSGNPLYNYQAPLLNSSHQDVVQLRLDKTLGRRDQLYGNFNLQSSRADALSLFHFDDTTDTLGLNTNINWSHRIAPRLFGYLSYHFSRQRTLVRPQFENRENISAVAGISGNDQDPRQWGPPALSFSRGIAALGDGQSAFNRNRTDGISPSLSAFHRRHNVTLGGDVRWEQFNEYAQQDPRGTFTFTGGITGSDLADFLIGSPDASSIAFGNADKYLRQRVYDAYASDDWRMLPNLTVNAGVRWEYGAPMAELLNRLVNLDVAEGFARVAPVLASDPVGSLTGRHYPRSLVKPDRLGFEPRVGISWRPVPASTIVVRAGYGIYHDTSVYLDSVLKLAQQAPLSQSVNQQHSAACPLTLADAFTPCATTTAQSLAIDPGFRVGYAQTWQLGVQSDLPFAMQGTLTYLGVKGTHGVQEFLPNSYPLGAENPCPQCPSGFLYEASGGNSTRQAAQVQLRRRLRAGLMASIAYTYSKSIDDDSLLGGQGHIAASSQTNWQAPSSSSSAAASTSPAAVIAQDWLNLGAERSLSSFDQRHLFNLQAQYTTGQGMEGGTLLRGWRGRMFKEWTLLTRIDGGTGMPETPVYPATVPGTGFTGPMRPSLTGVPINGGSNHAHVNAAAFTAPAPGAWGTAGRNSITGPATFSLDGALQRTFRAGKRYFFDARLDATNLMNHAVYSSWNTTVGNAQFGLPVSVSPMRSVQGTFRVRF
ncbi:carboxypeptidase regulatory-like domain-containing protein [Acidobacteria bacterium AB60]|nr:carboxypeptidase regulatory-like domain-containing protein [Acidobacteria bacterium AB60]